MKCIIIEDELPAQLILKSYIKRFDQLELISSFQTAIEANSFLKKNTIDLVFLDINLPDISGLDFIKTVQNPPQIIITTAYPDYALDSFELDTIVDYLVKPFSLERFLKAISKAEKRYQSESNYSNSETIFLNIDKALHKVKIEDILYIESDRNYLTFVTEKQKLSVIDSLKNWTESLSKHQFIQVHKSYLINLKKVDKVIGNILYIKEQKIPIGRTYKSNFINTIQ
ncbi:transcriptional regulator [Tenacibaculum holothuriorum]|uniref:Transcriptional regulator n=1 Tax=Tenacibaculum holothuriorum TaxID=1635173 RepID=A0A1Y2PFZ6_9FLAO|nr:LytTR family DNA-binding domain-containing protein [Tenacibaculum holothuriorum]OSY88931.1 transcriptional regulator [Tenacibaculum holothuriorum]